MDVSWNDITFFRTQKHILAPVEGVRTDRAERNNVCISSTPARAPLLHQAPRANTSSKEMKNFKALTTDIKTKVRLSPPEDRALRDKSAHVTCL